MTTAMILEQFAPIEDSPLRSAEYTCPSPGSGQVRISVDVCGVCHTDLHTVEGDISPPALPVIPGHQVVGRIESVGPDVDVEWALGKRVGVAWLHAACGSCFFCRGGQENLCPEARFTGFHVSGGYGGQMLARADFLLPLPEAYADEEAAPLLCAGIIGYRSLRRADVAPGERVGLFGFGASAHLAIQVARHWQCEVYVFTRSAEHRKHALALGACWVGGADDTAPKALDRAVLFAPAGALVPLALARLRPGGTLAINAIHLSPIPALPYPLIYGERTLRSVANATRSDGREFLDLAAEIGIRPTVRSYPLSEANRALADLKHSRRNGEAVLRVS